jgi:hypothetical protein
VPRPRHLSGLLFDGIRVALWECIAAHQSSGHGPFSLKLSWLNQSFVYNRYMGVSTRQRIAGSIVATIWNALVRRYPNRIMFVSKDASQDKPRTVQASKKQGQEHRPVAGGIKPSQRRARRSPATGLQQLVLSRRFLTLRLSARQADSRILHGPQQGTAASEALTKIAMCVSGLHSLACELVPALCLALLGGLDHERPGRASYQEAALHLHSC